MLLNVTKSRLIIGRFTILPGEKVPAFALTDAEAKAVQDFQKRGFLVEKEPLKQAAPAKKAREASKAAPKTEMKNELIQDGADKPIPPMEGSGENKGE